MRCNFPRRLAWALALLGAVLQIASAQTSLINTGAVWRYLDNGSDQAVAWREVLFDDQTWSTGPGQLGYGETDHATTVGFGPDPENKYRTTYFRHHFTVATPDAISNLVLRLLRDDGAIVYLNGTPVFRSNMPSDPIDYLTFAASTVGDADETTFFKTNVAPGLLVSGNNVVAVEIHQSETNSSDVSFDLELIANAPPVPPTVAIAALGGNSFISPVNVTLTAAAADSDGSITLVEFFQDGTRIGEAVAAPYRLVWTNVAPGSHVFTAQATDDSGLMATSAPVNVTVTFGGMPLIGPGENWKYLDNGSDQETAWQALTFDDSSWSGGAAQLGYGDGDEATVVSFGPESTTKFITTYFRHQFNVADPTVFSNLAVRLLRDDGGLVYLNGVEVFRSNMPTTGPVDYLTQSAGLATDESIFFQRGLNPTLLNVGANIVAVEIHQDSPTSSDISFDLALVVDAPVGPPAIAITSPTNNATFSEMTNLTVNAEGADSDGHIEFVEFFLDGAKLFEDATAPYTGTITSSPPPGTHTLLAVATDNSGLSATSAPVQIQVIGNTNRVSLVQTGAVWKYLDNDTDPGTGWKSLDFDDSSWLSGPGKLGFSDNPVTQINIGPGPSSRFITTYFRHTFNGSNLAGATNLAFRVLRDDGVVVHLNEAELFRMNMLTGVILKSTLAATAVNGSDESTYFSTNVPASSLIGGTNILAVELHQNSSGTSDAGFDLGLTAEVGSEGQVPNLQIEWSGVGAIISWIGNGSVVLQEAGLPDGPYLDVLPLVTASPHTINSPVGTRFFRLRSGP